MQSYQKLRWPNAGAVEISVLSAAEALLEESLYAPERLPDALDAAGRMLGFEYFCLVEADLRRPRIVASERQHEGIAAYFAGG